jgi:very-short-patch-repair endonuclease
MEAQTRSRRKPVTTPRARALRGSDNHAEGQMWLELKDRRLGGYKFVRQFPVGPYFADFLCRSSKLVVELDGSQHAESLHDEKRDAYMNGAGYSVIRFWSHDVLRQTDDVLETILAVLDGRLAERVSTFDLRYYPTAKAGEDRI